MAPAADVVLPPSSVNNNNDTIDPDAGLEASPASGSVLPVNNGVEGYSSSFDTAHTGNTPGSEWSSPRWEHRRDQRRRALPVPPMESYPPSGFDNPSNPSGRKKLLPGVIRNRVGTWVTNDDGTTAFYVRKSVEVGSFDFNSCGEYPRAYPSHDSFEDTLDEDEYSIVSAPCTGSFAFTMHPEDYQSIDHNSDSDDSRDRSGDEEDDDPGDGVPVSSVSIRRTPFNHAQDIGDTWISDSWLQQQPEGTPIPSRCTALVSLATSVDDALDHISVLYRRQEKFDRDVATAQSTIHSHIPSGRLLRIGSLPTHSRR